MGMPTILVIGGEWSRDGLSRMVEQSPCRLIEEDTGAEGIRAARMQVCDLVLISDHLPDLDPLEVCRQIRRHVPPEDWPLLILSPSSEGSSATESHAARGMFHDDDSEDSSERNAVGGTTALVFDLLRAVTAVVGRSRDDDYVLRFAGLEIDRRRHSVTLAGTPLHLTPSEFRVLWHLVRRRGYVLSRKQLLRACLADQTNANERTVDVHIKGIRRKLAGRAELIETVRGIGYRMKDTWPITAY